MNMYTIQIIFNQSNVISFIRTTKPFIYSVTHTLHRTGFHERRGVLGSNPLPPYPNKKQSCMKPWNTRETSLTSFNLPDIKSSIRTMDKKEVFFKPPMYRGNWRDMT